ncbi:UNVERIFIED_CONTAM: putative xyloglucan endotransglucosylase/hydrolase protein 30 [Sesamum calycinum]|uniref:Xyloglucan endotransglucosylase/hydrolase protein 30 n=1 Tax=Sesamum calycinum TaxID=2727403 RepID=A0AAW2M2B9_9LAMI
MSEPVGYHEGREALTWFGLVRFPRRLGLLSPLSTTTLTFHEAYSPLFSEFNIHPSPDDKTVRLLLNHFSGSGIISSDYYNYGFFSASIKMPSQHAAGIVVAFYTSNVDTFEKNHDELDIEFLGNVKGSRGGSKPTCMEMGACPVAGRRDIECGSIPPQTLIAIASFGPPQISCLIKVKYTFSHALACEDI